MKYLLLLLPLLFLCTKVEEVPIPVKKEHSLGKGMIEIVNMLEEIIRQRKIQGEK